MFRLLVVFAVLALAFGQTKFCCTPDQWEGTIDEVQGSVTAGTSHLTTGNISMSYDYTNKKMATTSFLEIDGKYQHVEVIFNYSTKMMYTIIGGQCTPSQLPGDMMKLCVPDTAIPAGKKTYGMGSSTLDAMSYNVQIGQDVTVYATVTTGNPCAPILEMFYGSPNKVPVMNGMAYSDITPGIKDPSVFVPPSSCSGQKSLKPVPVIPSPLLNYVHNKVTKH